MTDTPETTPPPPAPVEGLARVSSVDLAVGDIAMVFRESETGLQVAVFDNMEPDVPTLLIPLVRGIIASLNDAGAADVFIKKGVESIMGGKAIN